MRTHGSAELPRLAWLARVPLAGGGKVEVVHGHAVEIGDGWVVEGVWDDMFENGDFHRSEAFFGSGLRVDGDGTVHACASTALVDGLVYAVDHGSMIISNSMVVLMAACGGRLAVGHDYRSECSASLRGLFAQPYALTLEHGAYVSLQRLFHGNLAFDGRGGWSVHMRTKRRGFESFDSYSRSLRRTLRAIADNGADTRRRVPVAAYSTLSTGYDSVAVTCLAHEVGVNACFTTRPDGSRRGPSSAMEDGTTIARTIGLQAQILRAPSTSATTMLEEHFYAPTLWGSELIFSDMAERIASTDGVAIVYTGYHGDKVWDLHTAQSYLGDDILRGDTSGLNLSEVRLVAGFFNVALPFLFARDIGALVQIAGSNEMAPWRIGNEYDRPIPRRIAESAGVPRFAFGQRKQVAMRNDQLVFNPALRENFEQWLATHCGLGRGRLRASLMLDEVGWKLGALLDAARAPPSATRWARAIGDQLRLGRRLGHLRFVWAANDLADRLAAAAPELQAPVSRH